jgi:hypothetical protein
MTACSPRTPIWAVGFIVGLWALGQPADLNLRRFSSGLIRVKGSRNISLDAEDALTGTLLQGEVTQVRVHGGRSKTSTLDIGYSVTPYKLMP